MESCDLHLDKFQSYLFNVTKQVSDNKLLSKEYFCVTENMNLEGNFAQPYFENILIAMLKCQNSTISNITCKTQKEIDDKISGGYFQLWYLEIYFDLIDYLDPVKYYIAQYFTKLDPKATRHVDIYFKRVNISSDIGLFLEEFNTTSIVTYDYVKETIETT